MDLDQAMFVERVDGGYRVYYAIADVAAFVTAGDPVDIEANRRGETLYGADAKIPLHPKVLSEGAASLLPDQVRPALLWTIDLDATGEGIAVDVRRARVRSRAKLDYAGVQARIDAGNAEPMWAVLREIGELRKQREQARGGVSLPLPEQEVTRGRDRGRWSSARAMPVEDWNEQISLLTGMAAAHLMVQAKVGLLRTLPPARPHGRSSACGVTAQGARTSHGRHGLDYPGLHPLAGSGAAAPVAMMVACTTVLRGAGYAAFNGACRRSRCTGRWPSEYAHATAPLRRLVDRYTGEICVALCAGQPVPAMGAGALPGLPATMQASEPARQRFERAVIDLTEAIMLAPRVGEIFAGAIVELATTIRHRAWSMLREPAIEATVIGHVRLPLGEDVRLKLVEADPAKRSVRFALED